MDNKSNRRTNSFFIIAILMLAGLLSILQSSDLNDGVRYGLGGVIMLVLLLCVYRMRNSIKRWRE